MTHYFISNTNLTNNTNLFGRFEKLAFPIGRRAEPSCSLL